MNILHIGNAGNFICHTADKPFIRSQNWKSVPINRPKEEYLAAMPDPDIIIADAIAPVPGELFSVMPSLKMIHSEGVGFNGIDIKEADKKGIYVCNCAGMNASAVAEQTILLMLGAIKNVVNNDFAVRDGRQIKVKEGYMAGGNLMELADCRVGLVGFGSIGKATALLLKAFGSEVYYYKRKPLSKEEEEKYGASYKELDDMLAVSDIISLHLPVTEGTREICNAGFMARMKPGSYLVNTSRGELVSEPDLIEALKQGHIAMAALDTISNEPVQKEHLLLNQPEEIARRILFSPHIGGITASSFVRGYDMILENIIRISNGKTPLNIVNRPGIR